MTLHLTAAEFAIMKRTLRTIFEFTERSKVTADLLNIDRGSRATIERILLEMEQQRRNTAPQNQYTQPNAQ